MQKLLRTIVVMAMANTKAAKIALITPIASLLILAMSAVPVSADSTRTSFTKTLIAVINSGQEVPPTGSNALGVAFMTFDETTKQLCYSISFTDLDTLETAPHFHGAARAGENAPILFPISPTPSPLGSPKTGCVGPLSGKEGSDLKRGLFYINIHSQVFPAGEIRGQVLRIKGPK